VCTANNLPSAATANTVVSADLCEQESSCRPDETALEGGCRLPGGPFCRCVAPDGGITERRLGEFLPDAGLPMSVEDGSFDGGQDSGVRDGG
jgi:hypothetical protein